MLGRAGLIISVANGLSFLGKCSTFGPDASNLDASIASAL